MFGFVILSAIKGHYSRHNHLIIFYIDGDVTRISQLCVLFTLHYGQCFCLYGTKGGAITPRVTKRTTIGGLVKSKFPYGDDVRDIYRRSSGRSSCHQNKSNIPLNP